MRTEQEVIVRLETLGELLAYVEENKKRDIMTKIEELEWLLNIDKE